MLVEVKLRHKWPCLTFIDFKINFLVFPVQHHMTVRMDLPKTSSSSLCCCFTEDHNLSIYCHASQFHLLLAFGGAVV
jgi:hypothetical protein